jgi:hypothetical protein
MCNQESQNKTSLSEEQIPLDIFHADKQSGGQRKPQRQFA